MLLALCLVTAANAHPLNWTRLTIVEGDHTVRARLEVDLARYLGGYSAYHDLVDQGDPLKKIEAAALQALHAIEIKRGQRPLNWTMEELITPSRDDDFFSALPTPMAFVGFHSEDSGGGPFEVTIRDDHQLELPLVLRLPGQPEPLLVVSHAAVTSPNAPTQRETLAHLSPPAGARDYLRQGFLHVVPGGLDHVLFILGLFLAGQTIGVLLKQVSLFTLAHTLTLGAAAAGWVRAPAAIVEPVIALSILWLAVENLRKTKAPNLRYGVIFAFGLVHGLGFGGAFKALELPQGSFLAALCSFNLGVELGQAAVLLGALLLVGWWRQSPRYRTFLLQPACVAIGATATWLTIDRLRF